MYYGRRQAEPGYCYECGASLGYHNMIGVYEGRVYHLECLIEAEFGGIYAGLYKHFLQELKKRGKEVKNKPTCYICGEEINLNERVVVLKDGKISHLDYCFDQEHDISVYDNFDDLYEASLDI